MSDITIVEVSPRDGLQNESEILSTDAKVDLITRLVDAGARRIEAVSFAHPKLVPTMADAEAVMERVPRPDGVSYAGLILNRKGLDRAVGTGVDEVNVVVCVSDTFSDRNQNATADEAMRMAADVVDAARSQGLYTTITLATSFGCPFEGEVDPKRVVEFARRSADSGAQELCLADTIGVGAPGQVSTLTAQVRDALGDATPTLRFHFHNTRNTGFANAFAAVVEGVDVLDASAGGIGGCPFAPKATGNIATDDLVYMLERMGHRTGIDLTTLLPTAAFLGEQLGHEVPALLPRAGVFPDPEEKEILVAEHIYRIAEIVGTSPNGVDDAIRNAVSRANQTLRNIDWFEMTEVRGHLTDGHVADWQVTVKIGFRLDDNGS